MALTARAPALINVVGQYTECAYGIAGGSGTSTVVTVPQFSVVYGAIVGGATSATAPYNDTASGNTFTVTHASTDLFVWIAFGKPRR